MISQRRWQMRHSVADRFDVKALSGGYAGFGVIFALLLPLNGRSSLRDAVLCRAWIRTTLVCHLFFLCRCRPYFITSMCTSVLLSFAASESLVKWQTVARGLGLVFVM